MQHHSYSYSYSSSSSSSSSYSSSSSSSSYSYSYSSWGLSWLKLLLFLFLLFLLWLLLSKHRSSAYPPINDNQCNEAITQGRQYSYSYPMVMETNMDTVWNPKLKYITIVTLMSPFHSHVITNMTSKNVSAIQSTVLAKEWNVRYKSTNEESQSFSIYNRPQATIDEMVYVSLCIIIIMLRFLSLLYYQFYCC